MPPWRLKRELKDHQADWQLIDVRTPFEFGRFHIEGAWNYPGLWLGRGDDTGIASKPNPVLICMSGHRSPLAAWRLKKGGCATVYNLTGGMLAWKLCGGATVTGKRHQ